MINNKLNWAVIPCAGLGTRLYPVTKSVPKSMLPVGNYPIIHFAVKEAISVGIENILIIIGDGMDSVRSYFTESTKNNLDNDDENIDIEQMIKSSDIRFLLQEKPLGVGHAIKLTKRIIGDNSFAVILPDDLIFSKPNSLAQLKDLYLKYGGHVLGLNKLKKNEIEKKGIVEFDEEQDRFKIKSLVEKPKFSDAPSDIGILGRYILHYSIFDDIIDNDQGETNITDAISEKLGKAEISGKILDGYHFDTGNPSGLVKASNFFMKNSKLILEKY
ncbi:MAG: UTP--glucose-1-phosphate uridylyltransferase [Dehalococcoidia bacterium]|nr:UTP--glucose-1-phosphate uridylyltransferase [Dehalococcoidia bacterium]|tara:strand:- start:14560 stop:15378 length:819 start_codon:yes stop_codon:yes gene_type:complete